MKTHFIRNKIEHSIHEYFECQKRQDYYVTWTAISSFIDKELQTIISEEYN